ncbi:MAG TPA: hypothetical protein V6D20_11480 [Candidatus Obscuribacterales bacterium]
MTPIRHPVLFGSQGQRSSHFNQVTDAPTMNVGTGNDEWAIALSRLMTA